ncbi:MAG: PilZ domain-containing protein [Gammaproteobacteria bacterium]|jgi:hypothetical protein
MEHRWSARIPIATRVTLYRNKMPVAVCAATDIGLGGMFVATGPLTYSKDTTLEVDIKLDTEQGPTRFRLPACVVYHSQTGVGLMFLESDNEVSRTIRRLLQNRPSSQEPTPLMIDTEATPKRALA